MQWIWGFKLKNGVLIKKWAKTPILRKKVPPPPFLAINFWKFLKISRPNLGAKFAFFQKPRYPPGVGNENPRFEGSISRFLPIKLAFLPKSPFFGLFLAKNWKNDPFGSKKPVWAVRVRFALLWAKNTPKMMFIIIFELKKYASFWVLRCSANLSDFFLTNPPLYI